MGSASCVQEAVNLHRVQSLLHQDFQKLRCRTGQSTVPLLRGRVVNEDEVTGQENARWYGVSGELQCGQSGEKMDGNIFEKIICL